MPKKNQDAAFGTGAVRSANTDHLDFTSLPLVGLIGVARAAAEGAKKYGRYNYVQGIPAWTCVNHAMRHLVLWLLGDRTEPHLSHAAWNVMAAEQSMILDHELNAPHQLGAGATITPAVQRHLDDNKAHLAMCRNDGLFDDAGRWELASLPEILRIVIAREQQGEGDERNTTHDAPTAGEDDMDNVIRRCGLTDYEKRFMAADRHEETLHLPERPHERTRRLQFPGLQ